MGAELLSDNLCWMSLPSRSPAFCGSSTIPAMVLRRRGAGSTNSTSPELSLSRLLFLLEVTFKVRMISTGSSSESESMTMISNSGGFGCVDFAGVRVFPDSFAEELDPALKKLCKVTLDWMTRFFFEDMG